MLNYGSKTLITVTVAIIIATVTVFGHNPMASWAVAQIYPDRMELDIEMSGESAAALLGDPANTAPNVEKVVSRIAAIAPRFYDIRSGGTTLEPLSVETAIRDVDAIGIRLSYPRTAAPIDFDAAFLKALTAGHRTTLTILGADQKVLKTAILTTASPRTDFDAVSNEQPYSFVGFLKLGVEHILTGYDHLLFLFGLLIVCQGFRSAAKIITCFTIAHSLTLALAALDVVSLPPGLVEPLIAFSIIVVGIENIVRRDEPKWRAALTFLLGLVHGFGFAGALREAGLGNGGAALLGPLFAFNLGVEAGQVAVAAIVLPILWKLRSYRVFENYGRVALSALIAAAGAYWLFVRVIG